MGEEGGEGGAGEGEGARERGIECIVLGPPGYTQAFPNLRPGPLNCMVWRRNE